MTGQTEERLRSLAADLDRAAPAVGVREAMHGDNSKPGRLPRRTGHLALVAAAAIVVAVAVTGALMRSDTSKLRTGPAPAGDPGNGATTASTTPPHPTPTTPPPGRPPGTLHIPIAVAALPEVGIGMTQGDYVVLLDGRGAELGRAPTGEFFVATPGEPLGLTVANGAAKVVPELTAPRPAGSPFADDCVDAHKAGGTVIARCGSASGPDRIDVAIGRGAARTLVGSPPSQPGQTVIGHWHSARLSPDGSRVLAQWSAECEVPFAFLISTSTGEPRTVTGERWTDWTKAPSSSAGWLRDGRAVVGLHAGACGPGAEAPGVYISAAPGSSDLRMLSRSADGSPVAFVWERSDDHRWDRPLRHSAEGNMDTAAFNRFLADRRPPWAAGPETAAAVALGPAPEGEGAARSVNTTQEAGRPGRVVVTVIDDGLADDSIRSQRYRLTFFTEPGQPLRLEGVLVDWRCREGRGHENFSTEPCV